jgi:hypothetical protein
MGCRSPALMLVLPPSELHMAFLSEADRPLRARLGAKPLGPVIAEPDVQGEVSRPRSLRQT